MVGDGWVFLALASACFAVSYASLSCVPDCNVGADLDCSVQVTDIDCRSTAFSRSDRWPGKPEWLDNQSYPVKNLDSHGLVGVSIRWRTPSDASAAFVRGFEVSLNLVGAQVSQIRACYVFNLTRKTNKSRVILQELVESVFTLQCQVPARAEGILTQLYSLPKPPKELLKKRVYKYIKIEVMPTTPAPNPCTVDPLISTNVDQYEAQIIVKLGRWLGLNKYSIYLMKGSFAFDHQTIQPGNGSSIQQAVFGNPSNYQLGQCYSIWVKMESCENYWASWLTKKLCISQAPSTITSPGPSLGTTFSTSTNYSTAKPELPSAMIAVVTVVVLLILCLVTFAAWKRIRSHPYSFHRITYTHEETQPPMPRPRDPPMPWIPDPDGRKLVLFYCLSLENKKCVQEFEKFLKLACGTDRCIEFIDFVNQDEIDKNSGSWITALVNKIGESGFHLLVIYSSGLTHLFEAENENKYYPGYINREQNAEYVISFFKRIRNDLLFYSSHKGKEHVISLGSKYTENSNIVYRSLASFSGLRPKLLSNMTGRVSVNIPDMCHFLRWLGIDNPEEVLETIDTGPLEKAVEAMLSVEKDPMWFEKRYGTRQEKGGEDTCVDVERHSDADDSESDRYHQDHSSSGFGTGETVHTTFSQPSDLQDPHIWKSVIKNKRGRLQNPSTEPLPIVQLPHAESKPSYPQKQLPDDNDFLSPDSPKPIPPDFDPVPPKYYDEDLC